MAKLITPSLFNAVDWFRNAPAEYKPKAKTDLFNSLSRIYEKVADDHPMRLGCIFEDKVQAICESGSGIPPAASPLFKRVLEKCEGGKFQKKTKQIMTVDGADYCLYGKIDVYFDDLMIDLKCTGKYRPGKYLKTYQHKIYCFNENIKEFEYLVVEWDKYPVIGRIESERYVMPDRDELGADIEGKIREVMAFISLFPEMEKAYNEKFCRN
jgi:hypothetical protein